MVISRSLGRKRKVRTNKRRTMRGGGEYGDLEYNSDVYKAMDRLLDLGTVEYRENFFEDRQRKLRKNIRNLNWDGETFTSGYHMYVENDMLVTSTDDSYRVISTCSIPDLNAHLTSINVPPIYTSEPSKTIAERAKAAAAAVASGASGAKAVVASGANAMAGTMMQGVRAVGRVMPYKFRSKYVAPEPSEEMRTNENPIGSGGKSKRRKSKRRSTKRRR